MLNRCLGDYSKQLCHLIVDYDKTDKATQITC